MPGDVAKVRLGAPSTSPGIRRRAPLAASSLSTISRISRSCAGVRSARLAPKKVAASQSYTSPTQRSE